MLSIAFFRRVAFLTALFAYLQIALGGVVRVSGSGLGCPDWPLCNGRPYPPADAHAIVEYSHRAVGSVTGLLIIATVVMAWIVFRKRRPLVAWFATASLIGGGFALDIAGVNAYTMLHRGSVLVIGLLLLYVLWTAMRRWRSVEGMGLIAGATIGTFLLQVAVGAGSAIVGGALFDGLHVAMPTLGWPGGPAPALL